MTIREISYCDISAVAAIHAAAWKSAFRGILSDQLLDNFGGAKPQAVWEDILERKSRINLLAEKDGHPLGFVAFQEEPSEGMAGEIIGIYVHPQYWQHGIGGALLEEACRAMRSTGFGSVYYGP